MSAPKRTRTGTYIAGPMRGIPEFNFPAFFDAEHWAHRWFPDPILNPARRDTDAGFNPTGLLGTDTELAELGFDLTEAMRHDIAFIAAEARRIVLLPGWSSSSGATTEKRVAEACGLAVIYLVTPSGPCAVDPLPADTVAYKVIESIRAGAAAAGWWASRLYEPSDWALATLIAGSVSRELRRSGSLAVVWLKALSELLAAEAAKRIEAS